MDAKKKEEEIPNVFSKTLKDESVPGPAPRLATPQTPGSGTSPHTSLPSWG